MHVANHNLGEEILGGKEQIGGCPLDPRGLYVDDDAHHFAPLSEWMHERGVT